DLAVALERVAVAEVEEPALGKDGEIDRHACAEAAVVHVAAVLARGRTRDRLPLRRRDAEAAEHRIERQLAERLEPGRRVFEAGGGAPGGARPPLLTPSLAPLAGRK